MAKDLDLIKDFFGISDADFMKLMDGASKIIDKISKESENNNDVKSYYNTLHKRYDNGKLVQKSEKEFVNGQCVKDEKYDAIENKGNHNKIHKLLAKNGINENKCIRKRSELMGEIDELKKRNEALQNQIHEMTQYIDGLNDKIKQIEIEKAELKSIVDNIKNCF